MWRIVEIYLTRWMCDESFRYIKQSYNLGDIRVRSSIGGRNMKILVLAASYFASVYLDQDLKFKILVERIFLVSKSFLGFPPSSTRPLSMASTICCSLIRGA